MTFNLNISGESAAELLALIQQLNITPETVQQPQSAAVAQPEKPKAQTPAKSKKATEKPAAAPEKKPEPEANPTTAEASASPSPEAPGQAASEPDPTAESKAVQSAAAENTANESKIRSLVNALLKQGRMRECKAIINEAGAKGVSSIPPEQYTTVWEKLVALDREVNQNAAD